MSTVLVIGDTHAPCMRRGYVTFLKRIADQWGPNRIVHIGDLVDWAAISYHEKSPALKDANTEFQAALKQVKQLEKAFPVVDWMVGNHDALPSRKATTAGLPEQVLRGYVDTWELDRWTAWPRYHKLEIDNVLYSHGDSGTSRVPAALNQAKEQFQSSVLGHYHSQAGVAYHCTPNARIFGMSVGCGIDREKLAMEYGQKFPKKPILGCGIVVGGKQAYFEPWLLR